jgi:NAD(P)-dependent dehydrogenase (short-subunit alcohol dehydrogenase family)
MRDLDGKVILVTGATEGIGKAAALEFARRGAALTIVGRDPGKTDRVANELRGASGNREIDYVVGDLSQLREVIRVAAEVRARRERLDVLVNNAGAVFLQHRLTTDGLEMTFALNHMSYFVLTRELTELLAKVPKARIVSTSSGAHGRGQVHPATIAARPSGKAGFAAYCDSKLCNILFTRELARRVADRGIIANCFHPGFVRTGFGQNNPGRLALAVKITARLFARTPEKGAETLVWLASSPDAATVSGEYFQDKKVARTIRSAKDDALAKLLWELSERICAGALGDNYRFDSLGPMPSQ